MKFEGMPGEAIQVKTPLKRGRATNGNPNIIDPHQPPRMDGLSVILSPP
jgi:hypothetical protein